MIIRPARPEDRDALAQMRNALWPDGSVEEHAQEVDAILGGTWAGVYPYVILVAEGEGFAEVTLRSYADGCDPAKPVGYLEGWYVVEGKRGRGIGAALMRAAEDWARAQGCIEMASDTWITNEGSQRAHEALGYEEVDRVVTYRRKL
jgi:aminoglycoside 6'-N-acetyltransferase I